jgi:anti-sigma regulatory factor (Ser/Thr protein kinase)
MSSPTEVFEMRFSSSSVAMACSQPIFQLRDRLDVFQIQRAVKQFAAYLGFDKYACEELAIVASELASNVLKYGKPGSLELLAISDERGEGMALVARDSGPQFRNLDRAKLDGFDDDGPIDPAKILKRGGFGGGLGAVIRLTDSFQVVPDSSGKRVAVVRYLRGGHKGLRRR